ncbi:MAG TPA: hypothetical protein VHZ32_08455 [Rhizomicrobium sp.]|nr:hypothetical protein [Rhizomicrobium sp.]
MNPAPGPSPKSWPIPAGAWLARGKPLDWAAWLGLGGLTLLTLLRPTIEYDSWWYHLPFSGLLWNIGGGAGAFHMELRLQRRFDGFPLLMEWAQGALWKLTGVLNSVVVPQLVAAWAYFLLVPRWLGFHRVLLIALFFASPLLFIHFTATYTDLAPSLCLAIGFFLYLRLLTGELSLTTPRLACIVALLALAANVKFQSLIALAVLCAILLAATFALRGVERRRRLMLAGALALAALLGNIATLENLVRHGNPVYPFEVQVGERTLFAGPESLQYRKGNPNDRAPVYALRGSQMTTFPGPVNYLLSLTELDWNMRGVAPWYNIDMVTGKSPQRGGPSRTGGLGALFVVFNFGVLFLQLARYRTLADDRQRLFVILGIAIFVLTAFVPRSFELRYWFYQPLILIAVNARFLAASFSGTATAAVLAAVLAAYGMLVTLASPRSGLLETHLQTRNYRAAQVPDIVRQAWKADGIYCDTTGLPLYQYSTAATGLPGRLSQRAEDCRQPAKVKDAH